MVFLETCLKHYKRLICKQLAQNLIFRSKIASVLS